ncbi:MAG TPA: hypothetical protein VN541_19305, partial [Tepidisphaeraceae bacterium]|nr:hypothetical protein [Tepidisphaeraceae bacterium]
RPRGFNSEIQMQGLPVIRLTWEPVGQTAGAVIFPPFVHRPGRRNPDIICLLLNGLESPEELSALAARFAVPDAIWQEVLGAEKPIAFTLVFEPGRVRDASTITILAAFANSFFSLFGTNELEAPLMGS